MFRLLRACVVLYWIQCDASMYYEHNNMTCIMCTPGSHWVGHCLTDGASAKCVPCPDNHYLPYDNRAYSCQACRISCRNQNHEDESVQREVIVQPCTTISDLKCQCKEGFWRKSGAYGVCLLVSTCDQGQGVKTKATPNSDTVCEDCIDGETFSNVSSTTEQCLACSTCGTDEIDQRSCTSTEDTICALWVTTDRKELIWGLGVGISLLVVVFVTIGVGLCVCCCCRRAKSDPSNQVELLVNNVCTHEVVNRSGNRAHGTAVQGQRPEENGIFTHLLIDETNTNDTASRKESVQVIVSHARNRGNASGSASQANGASVNDIASHTVSAQDNENETEEPIVENGQLCIDNAYIRKGRAANVIPDGKKAGAKNKPSDASDPELFSDSAISVVGEEEKLVREQCYKLFRAWENNQTDVRELPAMEIPLELVRRLTSMFREDTAMNCSCTCLEILERYENAWFRKCRHINTRT
ncbi:uncharacterized protein LOC127845059 isoform X2 [Dreissena polymorpha]|uniref:uncharacterized protein LOC127845059 isoform X2 n=1 Tax=Dreissena polymorpha TaxID=45954 RepID=UPI002263CB7B|nr:uncharacterized protein LOC127845059 isoform X2 [Dreissena polymorpha]